MDQILRSHADAIVSASIRAVQPDAAVRRALEHQQFPGRVVLVSAGKAAWQMAKAAYDVMGSFGHLPGGFARRYQQHSAGEFLSGQRTADCLIRLDRFDRCLYNGIRMSP